MKAASGLWERLGILSLKMDLSKKAWTRLLVGLIQREVIRTFNVQLGMFWEGMQGSFIFMLDSGINQGCFAHMDMDSPHGQILEEKFAPPSCLKAASRPPSPCTI